VIATRSISIKKSGWDRRITPIMVLVGGCSCIAACSLSTSTVKTRRTPPDFDRKPENVCYPYINVKNRGTASHHSWTFRVRLGNGRFGSN